MTTDETGTNGQVTKTSKRREKSPGDPRFLAGVQKCIEKRCQLLGLDATNSNDFESHRPAIVHVRDVETLSDAELMAIIEQG